MCVIEADFGMKFQVFSLHKQWLYVLMDVLINSKRCNIIFITFKIIALIISNLTKL